MNLSAIINIVFRNKKINQDYFWRTLQVAGKQGIVLLIFIISAKLLTPVDFGMYSYIMAYVALLIIFSDFGVSTSLSRYVAEYKAVNHPQFRSLIFSSLVLITFVATLVSLIFFIYSSFNSKVDLTYFFYILPLLFLAPFSAALDGVYRGLQIFKLSSFISSIAGLVTLPIAYFLIDIYGIYGALLSQTILYALALIPMLYFQRHNFHLDIHKETIKKILFYSFHVGLATAGYFLFSRIDILILGQYGYFDEIATFEVLNRLLAVGLVPVQILAQVVAPRFSSLNAVGNYIRINYLFKKFVIGLAILAVLFFAITPFILDTLIGVFFSEYHNEILSQILVLTVAIYALNVYSAVISIGIVTATGYAKIFSISNIFLAVFNFILSILLLQMIGFMGVIYATLISSIVGIVVTQVFFYRAIKSKIYEK